MSLKYHQYHTDIIIPDLNKSRSWRLGLSFQIGNKDKKTKSGWKNKGREGITRSRSAWKAFALFLSMAASFKFSGLHQAKNTRVNICGDLERLTCIGRTFKQTSNASSMSDSSRSTLHTVFPPEVDTSSLWLTSRMVWPAEGPHMTSHSHLTDLHAGFKRLIIPKPKGMVGRIKEGGYSLIKVLGWEREQYNEIQVR